MFAPNVGASQQAAGSDQVGMFLLSDSRLIAPLGEKKNIKIVWDTTVVSVKAPAVPLGSRRKATAEDFLQSPVRPEPVEKITEMLGTVPINRKARPDPTPDGRLVEVYGPVNTGKAVVQDIDWYARHWDEVTTKLKHWLVS